MLAQTPAMGWNSWNTFGEKINQKLVMEMADAMVEKGYKDAGYEYVVIDDCWALKERDKDGKMVADPNKFPDGMKFLSDYIHSKGLKFGMYSCAGVMTCAGYPGSYEHEFVDAQTFADWGVDFLKYDFCHFPKSGDGRQAYAKMGIALKATGREILFSACSWGWEEPWNFMRSTGAHMYRSTGDICDKYESFINIIKEQKDKFSMSAPYCFNDMDMLIVGMKGNGNVASKEFVCSDEEYKMHFAFWCLFGTPLIIGGDLRILDECSRQLLQNKDLIRINQDIEARPPFEIKGNTHGDMQYKFFKHLSDNEYVLAGFNMSDKDSNVDFYFSDAGLPYYSGFGLELTDAFTGEKIGLKKDCFTYKVKSHGSCMFKAKVVKY